MSVRKQSGGKWLFEKYLDGGRRIRKTFGTKSEALAYENYIDEQAATKPWIAKKQDRRRMSDLVNTWYQSHGQTLKDGERVKKILEFICRSTNDPLVNDFTTRTFTDYRKRRMNGELYRTDSVKTISLRTLNLELVYLRAMFNELARLGEWDQPNPIGNIKQFKTDESEMAFLSNEQIKLLLDECASSNVANLLLMVKIGLSTGARWSEIANLKLTQIQPYKITYTKTKGRRNRTVPITKELYNQIPKENNKIFSGTHEKAFKRAIERAGIELPDGQLTHVLRHTFASHFMINSGNILVLQKILGHTDIKTTMRYAHLAPDHLEEATLLNPLSNIK
ncbi:MULTISPECIES: tyrosine-type recombinase/integrase [unclassified Gilliamella]|uniref:phage integrase n=1 Tax=unclassified Gilliamella TaxID=2685620 RepID=UPI00226ABB97|nr:MULTISPECIES: tyrosine-type recombinase/integrase [unclassified Gilliamella]MCX8587269.1 tyrosine-type recombinase/integrase [Gilliamella sp. B3801]MCX8591976.1 tyrosine-type recombinase/integrase [Gilliamella sp. B3804]